MAFKASKVRKRKEPEPVAEGTQLIASVPIRDWYSKQMKRMYSTMIAEYQKAIEEWADEPSVRRHYGMDATPASKVNALFDALQKRWSRILGGFAKELADSFTKKVDQHSERTVFHSLKTAGVDQPRSTYTKNIANTIGAASDFNNTLITNVGKDIHEKIYNAVMLSLTSPNPEEQGLTGIHNAIAKAGHFSKERADLIARDQNSKLYSSLNVDRMEQNGVDKFRWVHSGGGKVPRQTHLDKDGEIFEIDDPRLWQGPKADQGPPGWAINCRCRAVPVI